MRDLGFGNATSQGYYLCMATVLPPLAEPAVVALLLRQCLLDDRQTPGGPALLLCLHLHPSRACCWELHRLRTRLRQELLQLRNHLTRNDERLCRMLLQARRGEHGAGDEVGGDGWELVHAEERSDSHSVF